MENLYENLHKLYPVQKTLRFELKPIGKTMEYIEKEGILKSDEHRTEVYKKVKKYCDEYHKRFIDNSLQNVKLQNLEQYYELYKIQNKDEKQIESFKEIQEKLRKEIVEYFTENKEYSGLFSKDMFSDYLRAMYKDDEEKVREISEFNRFTSYFRGYNKNRENIYSAEEKSTSASYRIINENLPTFLSNIKIYEKVMRACPGIAEKVYKGLEEYIQTNALDEMFTLEYFNDILTQKGIEIYNLVISGKSLDDNKKIMGINEYINEFNQKNKGNKLPKLKELYKQILSDKIGTSFVFDIIENDKELVNSIKEYYKQFDKLFYNETEEGIINLISKIDKHDTNRIYLNNNSSICDISQNIWLDWSYIQKALHDKYDKEYDGKTGKGKNKYIEERKRYFKNQKALSISYLEESIEKQNIEDRGKLIEYIRQSINNNMIETIVENYQKCNYIFDKEYIEQSKELIKDSQAIEDIKELLDSIKTVQENVKILILKDKTIERDMGFYGILEEKYELLSEIVPLYNKVRNYLTQKPYSTDKIKLNFGTPTLFDGWDVNKEEANLGIILIKNEKYYLGIMNPDKRDSFRNIADIKAKGTGNSYKKINYKFFKDITTMIPKCTTQRKKVKEHFENNNSDYILFDEETFEKPLTITKEIYDLNNVSYGGYKKFQKEYLKNTGDVEGFNKALNTWMDFCMEFLKVYISTKDFDFSVIPDLKSYNSLDMFYKDINKQLYNLSTVEIDGNYIDGLVENGYIYLFQIYNKDFSENKKEENKNSKENLHTMYWKALFDEDNLKDVVYKLNGQAELFFRKASLKRIDTTVHPANQEINNKNEETKKKKPTSKFKYDIIKNKRYTEDKFQFHVPITLNFKNQQVNYINEIVNKNLKNNNDIHVIGVDRGERNLLYISVVDLKGNIVYQESLNEIINVHNGREYKADYHKLLSDRGDMMEMARKNWKDIENIKELKEGYMSQVINKIIKLMLKYNAIVVIEDLNKGFKNSRIKVEKQVYQKFEKMLIDKLNYVVIKDKLKNEEGGVLNGYQLTNKFKSFQKIGKQTGILFYIPAWCTSKIDPTTGFINLFYIKNEGLEKSKEFIKKFEDIRYNPKEDYFEFDIDYQKFTDKLNESRRFWTICTNADRIKSFKNVNKNNIWDNKVIILADYFKKLFEKYNIDLLNIKESILEKSDSKFFNAIEEVDGFEGFTSLFKLTVQMRNSMTNDKEDYLISPVKNKENTFFDSRLEIEALPKDADANGAYNIARKGLMLINQIKQTDDTKLGKIKYKITNKEWLIYAQNEGSK